MTNTFRKHNKLIMWLIIAGTIVTFVSYLSPGMRNGGGGGGGGRPAANLGSINGEPVTQSQLDAAMQEAKIVVFFRTGRWPTAQEQARDLEPIAYQRMLIEAKLKEMNIAVTPEAAARFTKEIFGVPADQAFPKDKFDQFVKEKLNTQGRVGLDDFDRFIRHQMGQQLLISLYGMNGELITAKEGEFFFRRERETMAVDLASFPASNYVAKITVTPQEVESYYTQHQADYRVPDREQVNYIRFDPTNYLAAADKMLAGISNLDAQVEQAYVSSDPATLKDDAGKPLSQDAGKAKIKEEFRTQAAKRSAETNAFALATDLAQGHSKEHPITKADLQKIAATNGLTVVTTEPFDEKNLPKELDLTPAAVNVVFELEIGDPDDQYKLLPGTNGVFLVGLEQKFPSQNQPLDIVRAKVTEDLRMSKALEMAKDAGAKFEAAAQAGIHNGQTFETICAAHNVKPESLTPFSLVTPSIPDLEKPEFETVARVVFELPAGQSSMFVPTATGGFVAFVKSRTPVDEAIVQRDMPAYLVRMRDQRQIAAFSGWFQREFQAHVVPPVKPAATAGS